MSSLALWLEGPLQAWGVDSKFSYRETLKFPSRSGVIGMILCAMGKSGEQEELLETFQSLTMTVLSYNNDGILHDFHMVGSGYQEADMWQSLCVPKTSDGKSSVGGGSKLTYRDYIQNGKFGVIISGSDQLIETLGDALKEPVWDLFLGRKTCVPSDLIYRGVFGNNDEAKLKITSIAEEKECSLNFIVVEGEDEGGDPDILNDSPISLGDNRVFRERVITVIAV